MPRFLNKLNSIAKTILNEQDGQDLTEYALTFSMVSLGAVTGMSSVASSVNLVFLDVAGVFARAMGFPVS
jgi:Flp pilus assembly pilin Flp